MPRGAAVKQYTETFSLREKPASERFGQSRSLPKLVDVVMCSRVGLIGETLYLLARNHNDPNWVILKSPPKPCVLDKIKRFLEANLQGPPTRRRRRSAITSARASGQRPTGPILFIAITPTSIWRLSPLCVARANSDSASRKFENCSRYPITMQSRPRTSISWSHSNWPRSIARTFISALRNEL